MHQLSSIADAEQRLRILVSQSQSNTQSERQQERKRYAGLLEERKQVLQRSISELEPLTEGASLYNLQRFRELYQELLTRSQQDPGPAGSTAADALTDSRMIALQEAAQQQLSAIVKRAESRLAQGADSAEALYQSGLRALLILNSSVGQARLHAQARACLRYNSLQ